MLHPFNQLHAALGIHPDMSITDYHASPGLSKSQLDKLKISPAHYQASLEGAFTQTPDMKTGSAVHKLVLEPESFYDSYAVLIENLDRRTKAGKEAYNDFMAANQGKELLAADDFMLVQQMQSAIAAHKTAKRLFSNGTPEQSVFWIDDGTDVLCKCRPDWQCGNGVIVDLKTTQDASPEGFAKSCAKYNYHIQAAFYLDGLNAVAIYAQHFVFVAVEKTPPFAVGVYVLDSAALQAGRNQYQALLELYRDCEKSGQWPAYSDSVVELSLPTWALK